MAIIFNGVSRCSICDTILDNDDAVIGLPHFIVDPTNRFYKNSDSGVHLECFLNWPEAPEFRRLYDEHAKEFQPRFPRRMLENGTVIEDSKLSNYPENGPS